MSKRKRTKETEAVEVAAVVARRSEAQIRAAFVARNCDNFFINPHLMQLFALQLATPLSSPEEQDIAMQTAGNMAVANPSYNALLRRNDYVHIDGRMIIGIKIGLTPLEQLETQFSTLYYSEGAYPGYQRRLGTFAHSIGDEPSDTDKIGVKKWKKRGSLHRDNGGPAYVGEDGTELWCEHGTLIGWSM